MNVDERHLVDTAEMPEDEMAKLYEQGYEPVPEQFEQQAKLELMGKKETYLGKESSGSLSKHMRYLGKKKAAKLKAERRKNRCYVG